MTLAMTLSVAPVTGLPELPAGADLAALIADAAPDLRDGDILVVTSKVVSKAEGRVVTTSREQAIEAETARVVARRGPTTIAQTRHGLVMAAAGVDESNTAPGTVVLLPEDPDESARRLREALRGRLGVSVGVVVTDTMGRPWRAGQTDTAGGGGRGAPGPRRRGPGQEQGAAIAGRARAGALRPRHRRGRPGRAGAHPGRERGHVPARRGRRAARPAHGPLVHRAAGRSPRPLPR